MTLRNHATSLAIMHAADVLQPLIILPYTARVLGPLEFGHFAYAVAIGQIAATIVDYGFHWTGQREAAACKNEPGKLATLCAEVAATKMLLCLIIILIGLATANSFLAISKPLFLCAMLTAAGNILFPAWLFIALEQAWRAAIAVIIGRVLAVPLFLALVTSPENIDMAVAIQSGIPIVSGLVGLPFVMAVGFSGFKAVTLGRIAAQLLSGWRGFLYSLVERAMITLPIPLVGHYAGYVAAANYSIAEKFVGATRPFFRVISETFMPRVAYNAKHDPAAAMGLIRTSLLTLLVGASISVAMFLIAPVIILTVFGQNYENAIPIVRVMSLLPILINVNICTSTLYMFNFGHERAWAYLTVAGLLVFLVTAIGLCHYLSNPAVAVAIAVVAREIVVLMVSAVYFLASEAFQKPAALGDSVDSERPGGAIASELSGAQILGTRASVPSST